MSTPQDFRRRSCVERQRLGLRLTTTVVGAFMFSCCTAVVVVHDVCLLPCRREMHMVVGSRTARRHRSRSDAHLQPYIERRAPAMRDKVSEASVTKNIRMCRLQSTPA